MTSFSKAWPKRTQSSRPECTPFHGAGGLDGYAYANNSPMNFVDPSGHCSQSGDDWCFVDDEQSSTDSNSTQTDTPTLETVPLGGTTPAGVPGFSTQEQENMGAGNPGQIFSAPDEIYFFYKAFTAGKRSPTLNAYLTYSLIQGKVYGMYITVENHGESSGHLDYIEIVTEPLASMNSCVQGEVCRFTPSKSVYYDPKNVYTTDICTNCLADNVTTFSMPKPVDVKGNYSVSVNVSITVLIDAGKLGVGYQAIPFSYTFPYP